MRTEQEILKDLKCVDKEKTIYYLEELKEYE